jgi:hypothetical protein
MRSYFRGEAVGLRDGLSEGDVPGFIASWIRRW